MRHFLVRAFLEWADEDVPVARWRTWVDGAAIASLNLYMLVRLAFWIIWLV